MRGFIYAFVAILLWSSAATIGRLLDNAANNVGIVLFLLVGGIFLFGGWSILEREKIHSDIKRIKSNNNIRLVCFLILLFGAFLGMYYSAFYYSIQNAPSIEANIINYLWPILTPFIAYYIFKTEERKFGYYELSLLVISFFGATLVAWDISSSNILELDFTAGHVGAVIAAVSAAIYLNFIFLIKKHISSTPFIYFLGMLFILPFAGMFIYSLDVSVVIEARAVPLLAFLTFVVFGGGQFLLIKSIELDNMITINALAYLTPLISSLFLNFFIGDVLTDSIIFGAVLIVAANILLNNSVTHFYAYNGAIIAFLFMGLIAYIEPSFLNSSSMDQIDTYLSAVFSIFAGFTMSRVWQKAKQEDVIATEISQILSAHLNVIIGNQRNETLIHEFIKETSKLDFLKSTDLMQKNSTAIISALDELKFIEDNGMLKKHVKQWIMLKIDRVSNAEMILLFTLGFLVVFDFCFMIGQSFVKDVVAILFSSTVVFTILVIRDYNNNRTDFDLFRVILHQDILNKLGIPYYLPSKSLLFTNTPFLKGVGEVQVENELINLDERYTQKNKAKVFLNIVIYSSLSGIILLVYFKHAGISVSL